MPIRPERITTVGEPPVFQEPVHVARRPAVFTQPRPKADSGRLRDKLRAQTFFDPFHEA
jgi:hypothetical protein